MKRTTATKDHIVPKFLGGVNFEWNIVTSCTSCNSAKGRKLSDCDCIKCLDAVIRWRLGERRPSTTATVDPTDIWEIPTIECR